ncbi:MAG: ABC transporter ATP-binding protein [Planctomycetota bacterium]|nr:ABC transporter ATP-binding protein [Planctomycetota bacterium]
MNGPIIKCEQLGKRFGKLEVLRSVDLTIPQGAIVGLLGSNGSGKSTLIKCLLGLLRISSGTASVLDENPWDLSAAGKNRLGYVPQVVHLYPWMKVQQVVDYTSAFYERWDFKWTLEVMQMLEVDGSKWIKTLSTGQLQRLAIILAFGHRPDLLVLDEPAASLDPGGRRALMRSLLEMNRDQGQTVLFSTHITSDLERVASHVAILGNGLVEYFGEIDELKESVKRIRIQSDQDLPTQFTIPGILHSNVTGSTAVVSLAKCSDSLISDIEKQWSATVTVEDLNLEEIFLEMSDV